MCANLGGGCFLAPKPIPRRESEERVLGLLSKKKQRRERHRARQRHLRAEDRTPPDSTVQLVSASCDEREGENGTSGLFRRLRDKKRSSCERFLRGCTSKRGGLYLAGEREVTGFRVVRVSQTAQLRLHSSAVVVVFYCCCWEDRVRGRTKQHVLVEIFKHGSASFVTDAGTGRAYDSSPHRLD